MLFVGNRVGFEVLNYLTNTNITVSCVFVDDEHSHELERWYEKIINLCIKLNIPYYRNHSTTDLVVIQEHKIDFIFCFGFRRLIPKEVLAKAKFAACSTHFSLLPKYRGFAPVNWAIINGEDKCGVSLFHMEAEADSGDIVAQKEIKISDKEYVSDVMVKCIDALKLILIDEWPKFKKGQVPRIKQDHSKATYTCSRNPEDGLINWNDSTKNIYNLIRGTSKPFPGAYTLLNSEKLTIWRATPVEVGMYVGRIPGKVIQLHKNEGVVVLTGDGAIRLEEVQLIHEEESVRADILIKSVRITLGR